MGRNRNVTLRLLVRCSSRASSSTVVLHGAHLRPSKWHETVPGTWYCTWYLVHTRLRLSDTYNLLEDNYQISVQLDYQVVPFKLQTFNNSGQRCYGHYTRRMSFEHEKNVST